MYLTSPCEDLFLRTPTSHKCFSPRLHQQEEALSSLQQLVCSRRQADVKFSAPPSADSHIFPHSNRLDTREAEKLVVNKYPENLCVK